MSETCQQARFRVARIDGMSRGLIPLSQCPSVAKPTVTEIRLPFVHLLGRAPASQLELIMRSIALVIAFVFGLIASGVGTRRPRLRRSTRNGREFFNKRRFYWRASLYKTTDGDRIPARSAMVKGGAAIGAMWKSMGGVKLAIRNSQLSTSNRSVPPRHAQIGTLQFEDQGPDIPQEVTGKYLVVWEKVGNDWKLAADIDGTMVNKPLASIKSWIPT